MKDKMLVEVLVVEVDDVEVAEVVENVDVTVVVGLLMVVVVVVVVRVGVVVSCTPTRAPTQGLLATITAMLTTSKRRTDRLSARLARINRKTS